MIIRLADIMFLHDPLNEEALAAKCTVLSAQGKKGIARNVYDRFCKEYRDSMGENYNMPQPIGILIHYRAEMSKIDAVLSIIL